MYVKFKPDLFLEVAELVRFQESLDMNGFRKVLLENSERFGLIKSSLDSSFNNAKVQRDVDNSLNQKTIKIGAISGIDSYGQLITSPQINNFSIPSDDIWYWVRIKHQFSTLESGKVTIDASGNMTGVGTEFTKILRSNQNFPSFIRFTNSVSNTLEYELADIVDDQHAIIVHPAITVGGTADFYAESNLTYEIIGTFTEGPSQDEENKRPFQYDSCLIELVAETVSNTKPAYVQGQEFYIARVKVSLGNLVIQDKRNDYWESKGSVKTLEISNTTNPLIGIEAVRWQNAFNTGDRNIVDIAWGMRSNNWSIDSSQNIVTFFGSSLGGSFKTTDDFTDGDLNGWRLYSSNGKYSKIINSLKQGGAINLYVDQLDVDNFSLDGGVTFTGDQILAVPDADSIEIAFIPEKETLVDDDIFNVSENDKFTFNINTAIGKCLPTVYKDPTCKYIVLFRYKTLKEFTKWTVINSGSYYTEKSFKNNGSLKPVEEVVIYPYTASSIVAFLELTISPNSYKKFKETVYKGDIIGVNTISSFTASQVLELIVGVDKRYQHIVGNITISDNVYISLSRINTIEGNEFRIHFDCDILNIGNKKIMIVDDYASGTLRVLKEFSIADAYQMMNTDGGIVFDIVFDNEGKWIISQSYELGQPFQITMFDNVVNDFFDSSLQGKVKGYFGWEIYQVLSGRMPVGYGSITDGNGNTKVFNLGDQDGELSHKLTIDEMPKHKIKIPASPHRGESGGGFVQQNNEGGGLLDSQEIGGDKYHNILSPYRVVAFIKRKY